MTTSSETGGSLRWMAPELLHENLGVSVHSDIWAYGMTFLVIKTLLGCGNLSDASSTGNLVWGTPILRYEE
jgi:serine/threonine protein kinase